MSIIQYKTLVRRWIGEKAFEVECKLGHEDNPKWKLMAAMPENACTDVIISDIPVFSSLNFYLKFSAKLSMQMKM